MRVTGVPVRRDLLDRDRSEARVALGLEGQACVVLVLGGSQGASAINRALGEALPKLAAARVEVAVTWVCGSRDYSACMAVASSVSLPVRVFGYLDDIGGALCAADLVVSRAGASTVAELLALGKPSVLVPYPHAAADHQTRNAAVLADDGAAILLPETELSGSRLAEEIVGLSADPARRNEMARRAGAQGRPGAARAVAHEVLEVMGR